jgi:proteic killer suppression protein
MGGRRSKALRAASSGNRLEKLVGAYAGQYAIRVNDQWRICFAWSTAGAGNVELVDYH